MTVLSIQETYISTPKMSEYQKSQIYNSGPSDVAKDGKYNQGIYKKRL